MNYVPVDAGTNSTNFLSTKDAANQEVKKDVSYLRYIALPNWAHDAFLESSSTKPHDESSTKVPEGSGNPIPTASSPNPPADQMDTLTVESLIPTDRSPVLTAYILGVTTSSNEAIGVEADVSNMETTISASPTPTLRIHKDHPKSQIIGPVDTPIQTRHRNKDRLVAQGHTQEEGIDYDEVFAPVARIQAIRLFLAYASFMGFTVYQMDVKSAFLYGTIDEEGHPKLGLWYPKESPFDLVAYSDSDYGGASQDRKSTTKESQFLGRWLISWHCKKQTIVATSTTEAEYVA
nr:ribonuclease H-like domain-containing protein [Tanacetum cinerariifolium]